MAGILAGLMPICWSDSGVASSLAVTPITSAIAMVMRLGDGDDTQLPPPGVGDVSDVTAAEVGVTSAADEAVASLSAAPVMTSPVAVLFRCCDESELITVLKG